MSDALKQRSGTYASPFKRTFTTSGVARIREWPAQLDIIIYSYKYDYMIFNIITSAPYLDDLFKRLRLKKGRTVEGRFGKTITIDFDYLISPLFEKLNLDYVQLTFQMWISLDMVTKWLISLCTN